MGNGKVQGAGNGSGQRVVLVTGCSSGIGHCVAHGLARRGWRVFAGARKPEDVARLAAEGLEALPLDLDDPGSVATAVAELLERTEGRIDALFNNGAYGQPGAVEDLSREALRAQFETNVVGWLDLTNRVIPVMRRQGHGRIVQNSSLLGYVSLPWRGAYNASKHAIEALSDTLRMELQGTGIHVSLVQPGPVLSRFRANGLAHFHRHVNVEASPHRARYQALLARLEKEGPAAPFTLPPEAVLERVIHALESSRPRYRYPVTLPAWFFAVARRLLPYAVLERMLVRAGG